MFYLLLLVTFVIALVTSILVALFFQKPIASILHRIVSEELATAWQRYLRFAIYVVGVSGGVRIWELEKYITSSSADSKTVALTAERWTLEVYRSLIDTLQSIAWMLLVFFVFALIAFVIVRAFELKHAKETKPE